MPESVTILMDEGGEIGAAETPWKEGEHLKLRCEAAGGETFIFRISFEKLSHI